MKINIGIITYHFAQNYGAVWQCYALQEYLQKCGYNVFVLNAVSAKQEKNNSLLNKKEGMKNVIINFCLLPFLKSRKQKKDAFSSFVENYLNCTDLVRNNEELEKLIDRKSMDYIISGSDQVWNPQIPDFEDMFFFPFESNAIKIGYSVSIGRAKYDEIKQYTKCVKDFKTIGVREYGAINTIEKIKGESVKHTIDPVLLLKQRDWLKFIKKDNHKKYLFCYFLDKNNIDESMKIAKRIAKDKGLKIKCISMHFGLNSFNPSFIHNAGPIDFLNYIYNADVVITDGYHGTVFSTIFNKEIYSIIHNKKSTDSRIKDYLSLIGLDRRIIYHDTNVIDYKNIEYDLIQPLIEQLPVQSYEFLKSALLC